MNKLTFASRYRPAAILAALAHGYVASEEPLGRGHQAFVAADALRRPRWWDALKHLAMTVIRRLPSKRAPGWRPLAKLVKDEAETRSGSQFPGMSWVLGDSGDGPLVSHFAFRDQDQTPGRSTKH